MLDNGGLSLQLSKRLQGQPRVLPEPVPAQLCVPHRRYFTFSPRVLGGKIPTPLQWAGSSTMAVSPQWQCPQQQWLSPGLGGGGLCWCRGPGDGTRSSRDGACRAAGPSSLCSFWQEEESSTVILNTIIF